MQAFVKTAKLNILLLLALSVCAVSCAESNEDFAGKLIATFQSKSINKGQIDWAAFSAKVQESARISKDSAIVTALTLNNNPHSWYKHGDLPLKGYYAQQIVNDSCASTGFFNSKLLRDVGYVRVPRFSSSLSGDQSGAKAYIAEIISKVKQQDRPGMKGWIIDLRGNGGGDMWPMLIALEPFLGEGVLGGFNDGEELQEWRLKSGAVYLDRQSQNSRFDVDPGQYKVVNGRAKIVVLINGNTGSSGEAVAIALKSLKQVKYFGVKTHGFATSNEIIPFGDGEYLILTTGFMQDIHGRQYPEGIHPDVLTYSVDQLREQVSNWLNN
jgi:carboxyl-terminal processing protease